MATQARTVVPDPWAALAAQCRRDARAIMNNAVAKARVAGYTGLSGAVDAIATLLGDLMASNAKLAAEVESLKKRRGWWPLGRRGAA